MEDGCHGTLICGPCILKAEWHYGIVKVSDRGPECCFLCVLGCHTDLIVSIVPILKENMKFPIAESMRRSMLGKANSSFGHTLFKLRKSIQHLICTLFFFTGTKLESLLSTTS